VTVDGWLSLSEASRLGGISKATLKRYCQGKRPVLRNRRIPPPSGNKRYARYQIDRDALMHFLAREERGPRLVISGRLRYLPGGFRPDKNKVKREMARLGFKVGR